MKYLCLIHLDEQQMAELPHEELEIDERPG
jgi:hypothetical protein